MNHWCESCARKNLCYVVDVRPKCFVPITNTASGTPESYLAKSLRYSRDSHEIAKDEPQTMYYPQVDGITPSVIVKDEPQTNKGVSYSDHTDYDEPKTYVTWTTPQTYKPTCNGECRYCIYRAKDGNYCMKTDCAWK